MPQIEGDYQAARLARYAVVHSKFNALVTNALLDGCLAVFARHGVDDTRVDQVSVPGSFEAPLAAKALALTERYAAVVCLGCIIRGETDHYDHVAGQAAGGVLRAGLETDVPVIFGILTTDTVEQALNRAGLKSGNKGAEAAETALEMAALMARIRRLGRETTPL